MELAGSVRYHRLFGQQRSEPKVPSGSRGFCFALCQGSWFPSVENRDG